jgi:hypothetical protein
LSTATRTPRRRDNCAASGTSRQPGTLTSEWTTPRRPSINPGAPIPTPHSCVVRMPALRVSLTLMAIERTVR